MKKIIPILLALLFVFAGCGKTSAPQTSSQPQEAAAQDSQGSQDKTTAENAAPESVIPQVDEPIITQDNKLGDYTTTFISKFVEGGTYYISRNITEEGETKKSEVAVSGQKAAVKTEEGTKVIDGDMLYFVLPEQKAVLTSPVADSMKAEFTNFIVEKTAAGAQSKFISTGKEAVNGEEFSYEEFKNEENVIKYYYDSQTIRYVRQTDKNGMEKLTQILVISHTVPEGFFNVPSDYIVQDLSKMQ